MRSISLVFLVAIVSSASSASAATVAPAPAPERNSIELVASELNTVARVTNAIFLQSARKSVTSRDIIRDTLGVTNIVLDQVLKANVEPFMTFLDEVHKRSKLSIKKENLSSNYSLLEDLSIHLTTIAPRLKSQEWYFNVAKFIKATDEKVMNRGLLACRAQLRDTVVDYQSAAGFQKLKDNLPILTMCFDMLLESEDPLARFRTSARKLAAFGELGYALVNWTGKYDQLVSVSNEFVRMREDFRKIDEHWKGLESIDAGAVIKMVKELQKNVLQGSFSPKRLTAGFESARGMGLVVNDVKTEWFKIKVSQGKSAAELAQALEPFRDFGLIVERLSAEFNKFKSKNLNSESNSETFDFKLPKRSLVAIDTYLRSPNRLDNFDPESMKTCLELMVKTNFTFDWFDEIFDALNDINKPIKRLEKALSVAFENRRIVEIIKRLDHLKDNWPNTVEELLARRQAVQSLEVLRVIYDRQTSVADSVQKLNDSISRVVDTSVFDLTNVIRHARLDDVGECINNSFNTSQRKMIWTWKSELERMADEKVWNAFSDYFRPIVAFQKLVAQAQVARDVDNTTTTTTGERLLRRFNNSETLSQSVAAGAHILFEMDHVGMWAYLFNLSSDYQADTWRWMIGPQFAGFNDLWTTSHRMIDEIDELDAFCAQIRREKKGPLEMRQVFVEATKVHGISIPRPVLAEAARILENVRESTRTRLAKIASLPDMNFAGRKAVLMNAATALTELKRVFDDVFGNRPVPPEAAVQQKVVNVSHHHHHSSGPSLVVVIVIVIAVLLVIAVVCLIGYGMTSGGRRRYKNLYLFYFGKPEDYEKRWRYSKFLDRSEGTNTLIEATRELNKDNVLKALRKGAYVNVYNKFGNTPLHSVAKLGNAELVSILIKHGANRRLLNAHNRTAEQLCGSGGSPSTKEVFERLRNRKFRARVPEQFPVSSFHIYIENRTDDSVTNDFMTRFRAITSEEALVTTTHCIVLTEDGGTVFATDSLSLLFWIFHGVIIVKDTWMTACLRDEKQIACDEAYLVDRVKFKGTVYENAVVPWTTAKAKGTMPYLYGVYAVVVMEFCANLDVLSTIITDNGGTMLETFPDKSQFNAGSHPYLHAHRGPLFVIHDGKTPGLVGLKADPMFSLFTEDEFVAFLLQRPVDVDNSRDPIHAVDSDR